MQASERAGIGSACGTYLVQLKTVSGSYSDKVLFVK